MSGPFACDALALLPADAVRFAPADALVLGGTPAAGFASGPGVGGADSCTFALGAGVGAGEAASGAAALELPLSVVLFAFAATLGVVVALAAPGEVVPLGTADDAAPGLVVALAATPGGEVVPLGAAPAVATFALGLGTAPGVLVALGAAACGLGGAGTFGTSSVAVVAPEVPAAGSALGTANGVAVPLDPLGGVAFALGPDAGAGGASRIVLGAALGEGSLAVGAGAEWFDTLAFGNAVALGATGVEPAEVPALGSAVAGAELFDALAHPPGEEVCEVFDELFDVSTGHGEPGISTYDEFEAPEATDDEVEVSDEKFEGGETAVRTGWKRLAIIDPFRKGSAALVAGVTSCARSRNVAASGFQ